MRNICAGRKVPGANEKREKEMAMADTKAWILKFTEIGIADIPRVGGKNASLGEMIRNLAGAGVRVPGGFAITSKAYEDLISANRLQEALDRLSFKAEKNPKKLKVLGKAARLLVSRAKFPAGLETAIGDAYDELCGESGDQNLAVAVRSSATAEDLPDASFAGQQETFLNIRGRKDLIAACRQCYASLFTDRAISYRIEKGYAHTKVALSIGVQRMVRSDIGSSGVMFSIDTDSGFPRVVLINAAF